MYLTATIKNKNVKIMNFLVLNDKRTTKIIKIIL